jgi:hypothetical protein
MRRIPFSVVVVLVFTALFAEANLCLQTYQSAAQAVESQKQSGSDFGKALLEGIEKSAFPASVYVETVLSKLVAESKITNEKILIAESDYSNSMAPKLEKIEERISAVLGFTKELDTAVKALSGKPSRFNVLKKSGSDETLRGIQAILKKLTFEFNFLTPETKFLNQAKEKLKKLESEIEHFEQQSILNLQFLSSLNEFIVLNISNYPKAENSLTQFYNLISDKLTSARVRVEMASTVSANLQTQISNINRTLAMISVIPSLEISHVAEAYGVSDQSILKRLQDMTQKIETTAAPIEPKKDDYSKQLLIAAVELRTGNSGLVPMNQNVVPKSITNLLTASKITSANWKMAAEPKTPVVTEIVPKEKVVLNADQNQSSPSTNYREQAIEFLTHHQRSDIVNYIVKHKVMFESQLHVQAVEKVYEIYQGFERRREPNWPGNPSVATNASTILSAVLPGLFKVFPNITNQHQIQALRLLPELPLAEYNSWNLSQKLWDFNAGLSLIHWPDQIVRFEKILRMGLPISENSEFIRSGKKINPFAEFKKANGIAGKSVTLHEYEFDASISIADKLVEIMRRMKLITANLKSPMYPEAINYESNRLLTELAILEGYLKFWETNSSFEIEHVIKALKKVGRIDLKMKDVTDVLKSSLREMLLAKIKSDAQNADMAYFDKLLGMVEKWSLIAGSIFPDSKSVEKRLFLIAIEREIESNIIRKETERTSLPAFSVAEKLVVDADKARYNLFLKTFLMRKAEELLAEHVKGLAPEERKKISENYKQKYNSFGLLKRLNMDLEYMNFYSNMFTISERI